MKCHDLLKRDDEDLHKLSLLEKEPNLVSSLSHIFGESKLLSSPVITASKEKVCELVENLVSLIQMTREGCK